jgi:hypothetical protein
MSFTAEISLGVITKCSDPSNHVEINLLKFISYMLSCNPSSNCAHLARRQFFANLSIIPRLCIYHDMFSFNEDYLKLFDKMCSRRWVDKCTAGHGQTVFRFTIRVKFNSNGKSDFSLCYSF